MLECQISWDLGLISDCWEGASFQFLEYTTHFQSNGGQRLSQKRQGAGIGFNRGVILGLRQNLN